MKQWSNYQTGIFDFVEQNNGQTNGAVIAVAGSGKTTVCVESMNHINPIYQIQFNCFNNHIKRELESRIGLNNPNIRIATFNATGWQACRKAWGYIILADDKKADKTSDTFRSLMNKTDKGDRDFYFNNKYLMKRVVSLSKGNGNLTVEEAVSGFDGLVEHHAFDIKDMDKFKEVFEVVYDRVINNRKVMDFDDQLFFPIKYNLDLPKTDYLFIDEFQDINLIQYLLVEGMGAGGAVIGIGDPDQSIYGFRGSAPDIFDTFINDYQATKLPLYICYRCPKAAIRNAQQWVPHIEAAPGAKEGTVDQIKANDFRTKYRKLIKQEDLILCRCIAPLVESVLGFIVEGRAAYCRGRDIGEGLIMLIDKILGKINKTNTGNNMGTGSFSEIFRDYVGEQIAMLARLERDTAIQSLEDQSAAIYAIMEGTQDVGELKKKITSIFPEQGVGIEHLSIHKSKGLETRGGGNVYSLPYKMKPPKRDWMVKEERRLKYVEATRTRNNHYYVLGESAD